MSMVADKKSQIFFRKLHLCQMSSKLVIHTSEYSFASQSRLTGDLSPTFLIARATPSTASVEEWGSYTTRKCQYGGEIDAMEGEALVIRKVGARSHGSPVSRLISYEICNKVSSGRKEMIT